MSRMSTSGALGVVDQDRVGLVAVRPAEDAVDVVDGGVGLRRRSSCPPAFALSTTGSLGSVTSHMETPPRPVSLQISLLNSRIWPVKRLVLTSST
jgi:hypothetical protein